jgi:hypothetical protein
MLRSRLLFAKDSSSVSCIMPDCRRIGYESFLLLVALWILISSTPILLGQADSSSTKDEQANPQVKICDGQKPGDPHALSLGIAKGETADVDVSASEQQSALQSSSESSGKDLSLAQDKLSSSATPEQGLLCKKTKSGAELESTRDPLPPNGLVSARESKPTIPTVSYVNGMLSIHAQNVPLREVIEAIRANTGIFVEFPADSMDDRVFDHVGPAPLRDALTQFLYGSKLNYVIQASPDDPQHVTKLVLSSQPLIAHAGSQHGSPQVTAQVEAPALYGSAGFTDEGSAEPSPPVPPPNQPTPTASNVIGVPAGFNLQQAAAASGKTTGQILDELQKQQLQALDNQSPPQ